MRLLIVTTSYPHTREPYSGIFVHELCKRLSEKFEVFVLAPHIKDSAELEYKGSMRIYRFRYAPISMEKLCYGAGIVSNIKSNPLNLFLLPFFAISLIKTAIKIDHFYKIDKIQAHWIIPSGFLCAIVSLFAKIPLLLTTHGPDVLLCQRLPFRWFAKFTFNHAKLITATSKSSSNIIESMGVHKDKLTVIPMGVDTNKFKP